MDGWLCPLFATRVLNRPDTRLASTAASPWVLSTPAKGLFVSMGSCRGTGAGLSPSVKNLDAGWLFQLGKQRHAPIARAGA
jgi:hypothetical protein